MPPHAAQSCEQIMWQISCDFIRLRFLVWIWCWPPVLIPVQYTRDNSEVTDHTKQTNKQNIANIIPLHFLQQQKPWHYKLAVNVYQIYHSISAIRPYIFNSKYALFCWIFIVSFSHFHLKQACGQLDWSNVLEIVISTSYKKKDIHSVINPGWNLNKNEFDNSCTVFHYDLYDGVLLGQSLYVLCVVVAVGVFLMHFPCKCHSACLSAEWRPIINITLSHNLMLLVLLPHTTTTTNKFIANDLSDADVRRKLCRAKRRI